MTDKVSSFPGVDRDLVDNTAPTTPSTSPRVTAVILGHNQRAMLLRVVAAVLQQSVPPKRIIVVDNASTDGSADAVAARFPSVTVLRHRENRGVGAGHNAGWDAALADPSCAFVWVLEHDCEPTQDCLAQLLQAHTQLTAQITADGTPPPIVVAPAEHSPHTNTAYAATWVMLDTTCYRLRETNPDQPPRAISYFTFNGVLLPAALLRQVGKLDEEFFFYWEDADYSERCRAAGARLYWIAQAAVMHDGLRAVSQFAWGRRRLLWANPTSPFRLYYRYRNWIARKVRVPRLRLRGLVSAWGYYCVWLVLDLFFGPGRRRRWWTRTLALRDGLQGRMGRAAYPFLYEQDDGQTG